MLGDFVKSALSVGDMPWQAVAGVCAPALLFFVWDARRHWRQVWWYWVVLCVLMACAWRLSLHVGSRRYYSVLVLPGMLLIFHMVWKIFPSKWRAIPLTVFSILLAACVVRDFRGNRQEFKVISLYEKVAADAKKHSSPFGVTFPSSGLRESYYGKLTVFGVKDDKKMLAEFLRAQKGNLDIYAGMGDVLYLFLFMPADFPDKETVLKGLMPGGMEIVGHEFLDRKRKKELWVAKYMPRETKIDSSGAKLLPNGDFLQTLSGVELEKSRKHLGRRAPRFIEAPSALPRDWMLYQAPTTFCNNWGGVEKHGGKNVLRMQADSYLVAISPRFDIRGKDETRIFFTVRANKPSQLEIARVYRDPGAEYSIMFTLFIPAGCEREYSFVLPPGSNAQVHASVHFRLTDGDIELSDVKIQYSAVGEKLKGI